MCIFFFFSFLSDLEFPTLIPRKCEFYVAGWTVLRVKTSSPSVYRLHPSSDEFFFSIDFHALEFCHCVQHARRNNRQNLQSREMRISNRLWMSNCRASQIAFKTIDYSLKLPFNNWELLKWSRKCQLEQSSIDGWMFKQAQRRIASWHQHRNKRRTDDAN